MLVLNTKIFQLLFITLLNIALASCTVLKQDKVSHLIKSTDSKIFKLVSVDESGNEISDRLILEALQQNISKLSLYPGFYSAIDDFTENVSGFEAIIDNNRNIKIQYLNGKLSASGNHNLTKATAIFKIEINKDNYGLFKTVIIRPPKSLYITRAQIQFNDISTLDTPEKLQEDVEQIFKNVELTMDRLIFISGEIIVRNTDDEVFDNFEHKLGLYSKNSFQERGMIFGIFELKSNMRKDIIPLRIRVFPNSRGSRVKYEFDVKYSIKSDGTTTYSEQEIHYLITTIKNISTTKDLDAPINHQTVNNKNLIAIIDDPVMISDYNKITPLNIHKTSVTYRPRTDSKPSKIRLKKKKSARFRSKKVFKSLNPKNLDTKLKKSQALDTGPKSKNIKNIEYIEKMLSSLKEKRPSK